MSMVNTDAIKNRVIQVNEDLENIMTEIKSTYENSGFEFNMVSENGFSKTNVITDLTKNVTKMAIPEESEMPSLGIVNGYNTVNAFPLKGYTKNGVIYADPQDPFKTYNATISNTVKTDRADGNLNINRWTSRNIFRFESSYYGYDRCVFMIPIEDLANGILIDAGDDAPHVNTLANYPYPEEIIMTSQHTEKNFIHFINAQYSDSHYGHFNGRNYNLIMVKDRIRYGVLDESGEKFATYTSVYANDVESELAYVNNGMLYLPIPCEEYGEELLNTLWDCRVIWRADAPDRNISVEVDVEQSYITDHYYEEITMNMEPPSNIVWNTDGQRCVGVLYDETISPNTATLVYSINGCNWANCTLNSSNYHYWSSICYGNDKFVAVAENSGAIAYSIDGKSWTVKEDANTSYHWRSICYGNDKFVAVSGVTGNGSAGIGYSEDGITWTVKAITNDYYFSKICYGNGKYVANGYYGHIAYSEDATSWEFSRISDNTDLRWNSICYGNGKFMTVSPNSNIYTYSENGIDWVEKTLQPNVAISSNAYFVYNKFMLFSLNKVHYSRDGIVWNYKDTPNKTYSSIALAYVNSDRIEYYLYSEKDKKTLGVEEYIGNVATNFYTVDDRVHLQYIYRESISRNRNSINLVSDFGNMSSSIGGLCSFYDKNTVSISPYFKEKYDMYRADIDSKEWDPNGTPNQLFPLLDGRYIGFSYITLSNLLNKTSIKDISSYRNILSIGIFGSNLTKANTSSENMSGAYPCEHIVYKSASANVIKVFKKSESLVNSDATILSRCKFYVFTSASLNELTITLYTNGNITSKSNTIAVYRVIDTNIIYDIVAVERLSENTFILISNSNTYKYNIVTNEFKSIGNVGNILIGRNTNVEILSNSSLYLRPNEDSLQFTVSDTEIQYDTLYALSGKYGLAKNSFSPNLMFKLNERYSFDKALLKPLSYFKVTEYDNTSYVNSASSINSLCYADGKYVGVGTNNTLIYSYDGIEWNKIIPIVSGAAIYRVCYGNGKFVAVGDSTYIYHSNDGIVWSKPSNIQFPSTNTSLLGVCYGNGKFVAVGDKPMGGGTIAAYSTDGINWFEGRDSNGNTLSISPSISAKNVCYGDGKFVFIGIRSIYYSSDGIQWSNVFTGDNTISFTQIWYGNGKFVIVGTNMLIYQSEDGINWSKKNIPSDIASNSEASKETIHCISYSSGNNKFVALSKSNMITSSDGVNWVTQKPWISKTEANGYSICYGDNKFVAIGRFNKLCLNIIEV